MMAKHKGTVGVVGLGIMGGAFATNLMDAGWHVVGYDIDARRRRDMSKLGIAMAIDTAELAANVPVIITSLSDPQALMDTAHAIAAAKGRRRIVIEASTFTLDDKLAAERTLRRAGHIMLDCPISGTGAQAKTKDIVVYASGDSEAIKRLRPLFAGFARASHDLGRFGNGSRMKFVANLLVAIHNVASAEAMVLGQKAGLDPNLIVDMVRSGVGTSRVFELRAPMMARRRYRPATMKVSVWQKDMAVIGAYAAALGAPTPLFNATMPIYAAALARGFAEHDTASVCAVLQSQPAARHKSQTRRVRPRTR
jgi:putative dehydrogenase